MVALGETVTRGLAARQYTQVSWRVALTLTLQCTRIDTLNGSNTGANCTLTGTITLDSVPPPGAGGPGGRPLQPPKAQRSRHGE